MTNKIYAPDITLCALCTGLLFFPHIVMESGTDGLVGIIMGTGIALIISVFSPYMHIKSKLLLTLFFAVSLVSGGMFLRIYSELISLVLLPEYPSWLIAAAMLFVVLYGSSKGNDAGRRFAALTAPTVFFAILVCLLPAAKNADIKTLLQKPEYPYRSISAGAILLLPLLLFYTQNEKQGAKRTFLSLFLAVLPCIAAAGVWQARFGYPSAQPVLDLMYSGNASSFIRRQEGLILAIITFSAYFLLSSMLRCAAYPFGNKKYKYALCSVLMLIISSMPKNADISREIFYMTAAVGMAVFTILIPIIKKVTK